MSEGRGEVVRSLEETRECYTHVVNMALPNFFGLLQLIVNYLAVLKWYFLMCFLFSTVKKNIGL